MNDNIKNIKTILSRQVVLFGGEYGRMKSLSMTALAFFSIFLAGKTKIVSNMPFKHFPENIPIIPLVETGQFDLHRLHEISGSMLIWDEMNNDVKSRSAMSEQNKYIPQMGIGFRKDKINLIGSMQYARTIDVAIYNLCELMIVPNAKKLYSEDTNEDRRLRFEAKDYRVVWQCTDIKQQREFYTEADLYPFINMYNTDFKPYQLAVTHKQYVDKLQLSKPKVFQGYGEKANSEIEFNLQNWKEGYNEIP